MTSVVTWPTGQSVTVGGQLVMVYVLVTLVVMVSPEPGVLVGLGAAVLVLLAETGQTVVYRGMVRVVTLPMGQLVTVGLQLVMV
jgi:hypothetical protein